MLYTRLNDTGDAFEPQRNVIQKRVGLDGGGSVAADLNLKSGLTFSTFLQYERWNFPLLYPTPKSDFTGSFQISFTPRLSWH